MEQYIPKAAVVAEIKRMIKNSELYIKHHCDKNDRLRYSFEHQRLVMCELLSFLDTLEVKEVDLNLDKKLDKYINDNNAFIKDDFVVEKNNGDSFNHIYDLEGVAKHFFELGMSVRNKPHKGE